MTGSACSVTCLPLQDANLPGLSIRPGPQLEILIKKNTSSPEGERDLLKSLPVDPEKVLVIGVGGNQRALL